MSKVSSSNNFSVNSLLSGEKSISGRDLCCSWSAAQVSGADLRKIPFSQHPTAIFSSPSIMTQQNDKTLTKLESNMNGTSQGFEHNPPYPTSTIYNGHGPHGPKIPIGSWQGSHAAVENKLPFTSSDTETSHDQNNWNPAFTPSGYKRGNYPEPCSGSNAMKKEPYSSSESSEPPQQEKLSPHKPKHWGSTGESDSGENVRV